MTGLSLTANAPRHYLYNRRVETTSCRNEDLGGRGAIMRRLSGRWLAGLAGIAISALAATPSRADVVVHIDKYS
jgi:hypothetical protein